MKPRLLITLIAAFASSIASQLHAEKTWEFPAHKLGISGGYNLGFVTYDDKPAVFFVAVCSSKIDVDNASVSDGNGDPMTIIYKGVEKRMLKKFPWVKATLSREQLEAAAKTGSKITATSGKNTVTVEFSAKEFSDLLDDAKKKDIYSQREKILAEAEANQANFNTTALAPYMRSGAGKITGQAFLKTRGGDVKVGAGGDIHLIPDTKWICGIYDLMEKGYDASLLPDEHRALLKRIVRVAEADAGGNFEFTDLPPGEYQLETKITWSTGVGNTGGRVIRKVTLNEGQTQKVMLTH